MNTLWDLSIGSLTDDELFNIATAISKIEQLILPDDAWTAESICQQFGQFGMGLFIATTQPVRAVNELSGYLMGYCLYQVVFETAEIHRIGTCPDFLRQGVASGLIDALSSKLSRLSAEKLLLEVRADNEPALALYRQAGFYQIDIRKQYYQLATGRVDALILQKDISNNQSVIIG